MERYLNGKMLRLEGLVALLVCIILVTPGTIAGPATITPVPISKWNYSKATLVSADSCGSANSTSPLKWVGGTVDKMKLAGSSTDRGNCSRHSSYGSTFDGRIFLLGPLVPRGIHLSGNWYYNVSSWVSFKQSLGVIDTCRLNYNSSSSECLAYGYIHVAEALTGYDVNNKSAGTIVTVTGNVWIFDIVAWEENSSQRTCGPGGCVLTAYNNTYFSYTSYSVNTSGWVYDNGSTTFGQKNELDFVGGHALSSTDRYEVSIYLVAQVTTEAYVYNVVGGTAAAAGSFNMAGGPHGIQIQNITLNP